ncbi:MAG: DUF421 domain-containing protein [Sphingomonas sp.]|nr:DUF421 domain-containing protein [Sphingomonas sp.]
MFDLAPLPDAVLRGALLALLALTWIVLVVRCVGLRAFSKMTAFDFVVTLAVGSLLATAATASGWSAFAQALVAIVLLLGAQASLAGLRRYSKTAEKALGNEPLLLMRHGEFDETAMRKSRVARSDIIAKLREANALDLSRVHAVVLETTGDISVLHGDHCDPVLLENVRTC